MKPKTVLCMACVAIAGCMHNLTDATTVVRDTDVEDSSDLAVDGAHPGDAPSGDLQNADSQGDTTNDAQIGPPNNTICDQLEAVEGLIFCDSFESKKLTPWKEVSSPLSSVVIEQTTNGPYRGHGALRVSSSGGADWGGVAWDLPEPRTAGTLYVRFYLRLDSEPQHTALAFLANETALNTIAVGVNTKAQPFLFIDEGKASQQTTDLLPGGGAWSCLQLEVQIDATSGHATVRLNDQEIASLADVDTQPYGGIRRLGMGLLTMSAASAPMDVMFDEVVLSAVPVPCD